MMLRSTACCGMYEYHGLCSTPELTLNYIAKEMFAYRRFNCAFIVFTDTHMAARGEALKAYIEKRGLGTMTRSATRTNPNSSNRLTIYVWAINPKPFVAWYNAKGWETQARTLVEIGFPTFIKCAGLVRSFINPKQPTEDYA